MNICDLIIHRGPVGRSTSLRAFGGGVLREGRLAKFIYTDEAGTDAGAPVTVVAGVIVDPDREWPLVYERLADLKSQLPDIPEDWTLHATELYSGGKTLDRLKYDKAVRFPVLEQLFATPRLLRLPVYFGYQWLRHENEEGWDPKREILMRHITTFLEALKTANVVMQHCYPGERANITAENIPHKKEIFCDLANVLRAASTPEIVTGPYPFDHILDTPHFTEKSGAPALVLADAIAFAVRLYLSGQKDGLWAMQCVTGCEEIESAFAEGRRNGGGSMGLDWRCADGL